MSIDPLVPRNIELRDFEFMPLDAVRLRDSTLSTEASGEEFRAAVLLWCAAWHQVPASSLPNNDRTLATFVGRDIRAWRRLRDGALRGFQLCSDGRLYHAVLAEKALEAWDRKLSYRFRKELDRLRKAAMRSGHDFCPPTYDEWKDHLSRTGSDKWEFVQRTSDGIPEDVGSIKGQGQGQGQGQSSSINVVASTHLTPEMDRAARACALMKEAGCKSVNKSKPELLNALSEGVTPEALADTAREAIDGNKTNPFAWAITTARRRLAETPKQVNGAAKVVGRAATPSEVIVEKREPVDREKALGFLASLRERLRA